MHQPPQQQHQGDLMQQQPPSRAYGHYINSNPSSTHSSPRSFAADLDGFYPTMQAHANHTITHSQTYPLPAGATINPYLPAQQRRPQLPNMQQSRSTSYSSYTAPALQVSTSTSSVHEHDPNERTARPGNAHAHTQFHSALEAGTASSGSASTSNSNSTTSSASNAANGDQQSQQNDYTSSTPGLSQGLSRPLKPIEQERLAHLDRLKFFLATAPSRWDSAAANANPPPSGFSGVGGGDFGSSFGSGPGGYGTSGVFPGMGLGLEPAYHHAPPHPALNRFLLPNQEFVTCVLWNGLYHITGTDIVRALVFRFEAFGRPVRNMKKFEEGVFSDLRNLKPGVDACLEEPKSPFLDLLFKYQCIRTQKKQKVFYWFSVPHDRLFLDALERDLKREKMGQEPTTEIVGEPALSFTYDPKRSLYEQFSKAQGVRDGESELEAAIRNHDEANESGGDNAAESGGDTNMTDDSEHDGGDESGAGGGDESDAGGGAPAQRRSTAAKRASGNLALGPNGQPIFQMLSLFTGSPTYKQRRKKGTKASSLRKGSEDYAADGEYDRGRSMDGGSGRFSSLSRERRVHMPMHGSMMEEFGPGSAAEKARQADEMSAAEMFLKQARGQLVPGDGVVRKPRPQNVVGEVGVYYHDPATHDQVGSVQRMHGHMRGKSYDERDPNSEQSRPPAPMSAGLATRSFADAQAQAQGLTNISPYEAVSADGKTRAFVCPLYSCSRLFKRMEHLKRHMRTHTMERPFPCPRCNKNFSRSDNLTQHLRTHERTGHGPQVPGGDPGAQGWDSESGNEGSTNEDSPGHGNISESDDDVSGMMGFGQNQAMTGLEPMFSGVGIGNMDLSGFGGMLSGNVDMQHDSDFASMCEVEIPGGVRDVPGNEGELVPMGDSSLIYRPGMVQQSDEYFSSLPSSATTSGLLFSSTDSTSADLGDNSQWATRPQSSMAFSSNQPGARGLHQMRSFHGHHSSSLSQSSNISEDFLAASLSAPSHKQSFEHAALYPPGLLDNPVASGVGPVRRHRSMTPSIARNGEPIRRPMTANNELQGVGGGSPASVSSLSSNRGYHPYAGYSNSNSRANSTHNSPQVVSVPLGDHHRSESRNSSYGGLHEQMRQMMNVDSGNNVDGPASLFPSDSMFRTGSPASFHQTESPGTFSVDLPTTSNMYPGAPGFMHAATMPVGSQYGQQQQQQQFEGNFYQHNNTL